MTRRRQVVPETNICGACAFCRVAPNEKDMFLCWVSPTSLLGDCGESEVVRELPVEPSDPKCMHYQPRHNS
jgi:hypothetical protein